MGDGFVAPGAVHGELGHIAVAVILVRIVYIKKDHNSFDIGCLTALCLTGAYIILLSSVVGFTYVERTEVVLPVAFWGLLMLMMCVGGLSEKISFSNTVLIVIAGICVIGTVYYSGTYKEMNFINLPYENCVVFADDVIAQFKEAEEKGETEVDLVLPKFDTDDNWPIADYASGHFSNAMYFHGVTGKYMDVREMIFTEEKNRQFGIE